MKKIFALMLVGGMMFTGCDLLGGDDEDSDNKGESGIKATLSSSKDGVVYNVTGADKGAYDLLEGAGVSFGGASDGATKDLADFNPYDETDGFEKEDFSTMLTSGNDAMFLEDLDITYSSSAGSIVDAVYPNLALATSKTSALEVGDVVVVILAEGRSETYEAAIVEITEVVEDSGAGDNSGMIGFKYKLIDIDESTLPTEDAQ